MYSYKLLLAGPAKKAKRVSDINALGGNQVINLNQANPALTPNIQQSPANYYTPNTSPLNYGQPQPQQQPQYQPEFQNNFQNTPVFDMAFHNNDPQQQTGVGQPNFAMFQQPIVQDMALQYGQKLADQGKELVHKELEKYVSVSKLKYYFAVDNRYVLNKLRLIFFPFAQRDWSLKFDQDQPVQPRYDINAPDLYIPTMGFITYIVLAGFMLGMQERFSPEQLGIQASSALAYNIFELIVYTITLYVTNIQTNLRTLDLVAFSGYKYASIVAILCSSMLFSSSGYWIGLLYCGATLSFFLVLYNIFVSDVFFS